MRNVEISKQIKLKKYLAQENVLSLNLLSIGNVLFLSGKQLVRYIHIKFHHALQSRFVHFKLLYLNFKKKTYSPEKNV